MGSTFHREVRVFGNPKIFKLNSTLGNAAFAESLGFATHRAVAVQPDFETFGIVDVLVQFASKYKNTETRS